MFISSLGFILLAWFTAVHLYYIFCFGDFLCCFFAFCLEFVHLFCIKYYSDDYLSSKVLFCSGDYITIGCLVV